ncbi:hypothetical protein R3P38DRAFT_2806295 [Favolaschia claudopus]|uniref:Uncharacterized protein n=1 Tax=Favolaschia claudopus TaxID=2862362 RepID=A0AAV9ZKD5_9AGAR
MHSNSRPPFLPSFLLPICILEASVPLPKLSSGLAFNKTSTWFSKDAPTTPLHCLLDRPVPPLQFLDDLSKAVGQAWFDGCISIFDPRYNDGRDRLPLPALTLWKELGRVVKDQCVRKGSRDWVDEELRKPGLDGKIILSNAWLSDDHIDMMMTDLSARLAAEPELAQRVLIAPLAFSRTGLTELHFPIHIHGNHWIAGTVDFKQRLIGTVTRNTVAVNVFGEEVWEQKYAAAARVTTFIRLVRSGAIRRMAPTIPKAAIHLSNMDMPAEVSIAVALGDHNFPDLATFAALEPPKRSTRPTLADLMNPAPTKDEGSAGIVSSDISGDVSMDDCTLSGPTEGLEYTGDHGGIVSNTESELLVDQEPEGDEENTSAMDIDRPATFPASTAVDRRTLFGFFGATPKAKPEPATTKTGKRRLVRGSRRICGCGFPRGSQKAKESEWYWNQ